MKKSAVLSVLVAGLTVARSQTGDGIIPLEPGFVPLFNGRNLDGWTIVDQDGPGWRVENRYLLCPAEEGGNLFTLREFGDFVLRFDFRLAPGANSGIGVRAPHEGNTAFMGMEIQILDDSDRAYSNLRPTQYHGSIIDVVPARRAALKKPGEWNSEEIRCRGRIVQVFVNGQPTLDVNLNTITDPVVLQRHPGMLRERGYIGLIGNKSRVEFRNIRISEIVSPSPDNRPPPGFKALFDGSSLAGWTGLRLSPERSKVPLEGVARSEAEAIHLMHRNWRVDGGVLTYTGSGCDNLVTVEEFGDFELRVDWMINPGGDSGIFLRGTPQVQIADEPTGSGGISTNKRHPSTPMAIADHPPGQWNRFCILMTGEKVTVYLNNTLVVHNVTFENFWEQHRPIKPIGPIELQANRTWVAFKNIFIRPLPRL